MNSKENQNILISIIIGTRPEAIKLSPLILEFQKRKDIQTRLILTGQHKEMVSQVLEMFGLHECLDLKIMKKKQSLGYLTNAVMIGLEKDFLENKPNLVIVQGDTTTAFAAALTSFYLGIKIAHVEAGLRTNNLNDPFPEEANRKMITQLASLHFAPTQNAFNNLTKSFALGRIEVTGNTVIDALLFIKNKYGYDSYSSKNNPHKLILTSIHRRENWGQKIESIAYGIRMIAEKHENVRIILPLHKNEIVRKPLQKILGGHSRIELVEPLNYSDLVSKLSNCYFVLTDSGGIQEEAPALGKPVLVLRETTERPEAIDAGTAKLIGTNSNAIVKEATTLLKDKDLYHRMSRAINPFGDGFSSKRIVDICLDFFGLT